MKLFNYQQEIVDKRYEPSLALFMSMGTGKTFVSIAMFQKSERKKLLVMCLATKVTDWERDLEHELGRNVTTLNKGTKKNKQLIADGADTLVISFESAWRADEALINWVDNDVYIIIDESHKLKNPSSKVGKFARKIGDKTNFKVILTGTPQSKGYIDYYNQFRFLGYLDMNQTKFKKMFMITRLMSFGGPSFEEIVGYKHTDVLDRMIELHSVFYERKLDDADLPEHVDVMFKNYPKGRKIAKEKVYTFKNGELAIYDSLGGGMMLQRQLASGYIAKGGQIEVLDRAKLDWVQDMLEGYDKRVVIFYNFNAELHELKKVLDKLKKPYSEYNGGSKDLTSFKHASDGIVLANYGSGSTGINDFVIAGLMVMFSLPTSYIDFQQAKKRIDRIGQTEKPLFYYLVREATIESNIYQNLQLGLDFDETMYEKYEFETEGNDR